MDGWKGQSMIKSKIGSGDRVGSDTERKSDHILSQRIDAALWFDEALHGINYEDIQIHCRADVVRIEGHIGTLLQKAQIDSVVHHVPNVAELENRLIVDEELVHQAAQVLAYDARMHGEQQIVVNAQHGFIYLSGTTSNATIRQLASEIVADLHQVRGIINRIQAPGVAANEDEDRIIQPVIGSEVFATDGSIGCLQKVLLNPYNRRVTGLLVLAHFPSFTTTKSFWHLVEEVQQKRSVMIPVHAIRNALNSGVFLNTSGQQTAQFGSIDSTMHISPTAEWQPPYPYHPTDILIESTSTSHNDNLIIDVKEKAHE